MGVRERRCEGACVGGGGAIHLTPTRDSIINSDWRTYIWFAHVTVTK